MLALRVIPTLLLHGAGLVKGEGFDARRRIGSALQAVRVFEARQVDELIVLDIAATPQGRGPDLDAIANMTEGCFMPVTVGGGVRCVEDFRALLMAGADKIAICTAALDDPDLISRASRRCGAQCVTVAIDVRAGVVTSRCGTQPTGRDPVAWAQECVDRGAGEILLTAVERDGTMTGYDLDLIRSVASAVSVPVIASGGASGPEDFEAADAAGASAVAAGALWQFTTMTPLLAKRHLASRGVPVRL